VPHAAVNGSWGSGESLGGKGSWRGEGGLAGFSGSPSQTPWLDADGTEVSGGLSPGLKTLYEALEQMLLLATDPSVKVRVWRKRVVYAF
jgi:hypothetical protein